MTLTRAGSLLATAQSLLTAGEYTPDGAAVLRLVPDSGCTAYDLEFVALAMEFGVRLVTVDKQVLAAFPDTAVHPSTFAG